MSKAECFSKPPSMKHFLGRILGASSLLLTDGNAHALQRRLISSAFTFDLLQKMLPIMRRCAWAAVDMLEPSAVASTDWLFDPERVKSTTKPMPISGDAADVPDAFLDVPVVDACAAMSGLTLEIIAQSAFGGSFGGGSRAPGRPSQLGCSEQAKTVVEALESGFRDIGALIAGSPIVLLLPWMDTFLSRPEKSQFLNHRGRLDSLAQRIICSRRAKLESLAAAASLSAEEAAEAETLSSDLLGLMIRSSVEGGVVSAKDSYAYRTGADAVDVEMEGDAGSTAAADAAAAVTGIRHRSSVTRLTDEELRDQCVTFVMAGHETTSQLLTWSLYCLSQAPEWQERLRTEARRVFSAGGAEIEPETSGEPLEGADQRVPRLGDIKTGMPVCSAVLQEVMRLYAPASMVARRVVKAVTIGKGETQMHLPAGAEVMIPIGAMHRNEELFADPDDFDPARWLSDDQTAALGMCRATSADGSLRPDDDPVTTARPELTGLSPFSYLPFSAGSRNCVGQRFAQLEAHVCLSVLAAKLEWYLDPKYMHSPSMRITMQAMHGMPMRFRKAD